MFTAQTETPGQARLVGRLDASQTAYAETEMSKLQGAVTVDLSGLNYISSAGLGLFIDLYQRLTSAGGSLVIVGASDHIRHIFRLARLDQVFTFR